MADPTWGLLQKNLTDAETIEQAIDRIVAAHEADPTAHLGTGESLEAHKADEVLDHPAGSVAVDKISLARVLMTSFESIDGWTSYKYGTGNIINDFGSVTLTTGATSGSYAGLTAVPAGLINFDIAKKCFWRCILSLAQITNQSFYFGIGYLIDLVDFNGFGFKVSNGSLYAYMGDYSNYTEMQIVGFTLTERHTYEIRYNPIGPLVEFYIDGGLVASFDSGNFPESADQLAAFMLKNSAASAKYAYLYNLMYEQDF